MEALSSFESLLNNNGGEESRDKGRGRGRGRERGRERGRDRGRDRNIKNIGSIPENSDVSSKENGIIKNNSDFDFFQEKIPESVLRVYGSSGSKVQNRVNVQKKIKIYDASSFGSHSGQEGEERQAANVFIAARQGRSVSC